MYFTERTLTFIKSVLKSYGHSNVKRLLWDKEYSGDKWNFADNTLGDCVYIHLEKYVRNGSILDLGCGTGNTATELAASVYRRYVGVDISETGLRKAMRRSHDAGRTDKNHFERGDFLNYVPTQQFDVILFRESMYHVPLHKIKTMLDRYSLYLKDGGVFVVKMNASGGKLARPKAMVGVMETEFDVMEKQQYGDSGPTVIVFRPNLPITKGVDRRFGEENVGEKHA